MSNTTLFSISIPEGTLVSHLYNTPDGIKGHLVPLKAPVYVDNATRLEDGAYAYCLNGRDVYNVSAGCVSLL